MNNLVMSWSTEDGRLVCRWSESEDRSCEPAVPPDSTSPRESEYWNSDVVFELGDAA
jgi:hypothetical protein